MKRTFIFIMTLSLLFALCGVSAAALSKMGSRSDEVKKIQEALKNKGYYTYNVDGISAPAQKTPLSAFKRITGLTPMALQVPQRLRRSA